MVTRVLKFDSLRELFVQKAATIPVALSFSNSTLSEVNEILKPDVMTQIIPMKEFLKVFP